MVLGPATQCGPQISSVPITWDLLEVQNFSPTPDLLNQSAFPEVICVHIKIWEALLYCFPNFSHLYHLYSFGSVYSLHDLMFF